MEFKGFATAFQLYVVFGSDSGERFAGPNLVNQSIRSFFQVFLVGNLLAAGCQDVHEQRAQSKVLKSNEEILSRS